MCSVGRIGSKVSKETFRRPNEEYCIRIGSRWLLGRTHRSRETSERKDGHCRLPFQPYHVPY